jgi:hypothetical protein
LLPAARESISEDSDWNCELRDQIPGLLLKALDELVQVPSSMNVNDDGLNAVNAVSQEGLVKDEEKQQEMSAETMPDEHKFQHYLMRFNFWLSCLPLHGVAKVREMHS